MVIAYIAFWLSLFVLLLVAFRSRNDVATVFGFIFVVYSLGFVEPNFTFDYFSVLVNVKFDAIHYAQLTLLNILSTLAIVASDCIRLRPVRSTQNRLMGYVFVALGLYAMVSEWRFFGTADFLLSDKAMRFAGAYGAINNLFIISVDYHLFIMAGAYALTFSATRKYRLLLYTLIGLVAVMGFLQGYRYYIAVLFLFVFLSIAKRKLRFGLPVVIITIFLGIFLAEFSKILLSWILYYDWVHQYGFLNFLAMNYTSWLPKEVQAIAVNTYLGLSVYRESLHPDILGYFIKMIPFSERFYDFSSFDQLYRVLGQDLKLGEGQGTAFSFYLDNYVSYFVPLLIAFGVLALTRLHPTPIIKVVALFFFLNLIRNGFLVSIAAIKIPLLIYAVCYIAFVIVMTAARHDQRTLGSLGTAQPTYKART